MLPLKAAAKYFLEQSHDMNALFLQRIPLHMWETPHLLREPAKLQTLFPADTIQAGKYVPLDSSFNINIIQKAIHLVQHA